MSDHQDPARASDSASSTIQQKLKAVADVLPAVGFFGVFFLLGRDLVFATVGLLVGLILQLAIYKLIRQAIPTWMKILTVVALVFATLTLLFQDPNFIKIRATVSGFIVGCVFAGSVLVNKNILQLLLGKMIVFPDRTWSVITLLSSIPLFLNAILNLFLGNLVPWVDWQVSDDIWVGYRAVSGFLVLGVGIALILSYLAITKQKPSLKHEANSSNKS